MCRAGDADTVRGDRVSSLHPGFMVPPGRWSGATGYMLVELRGLRGGYSLLSGRLINGAVGPGRYAAAEFVADDPCGASLPTWSEETLYVPYVVERLQRLSQEERHALCAFRTISANARTSRLAPPTSAPSTSACSTRGDVVRLDAAAIQDAAAAPRRRRQTTAACALRMCACASCACSGVALRPVPIAQTGSYASTSPASWSAVRPSRPARQLLDRARQRLIRLALLERLANADDRHQPRRERRA